VDKHFEQGESSAAANGQPPRQDASAQPPQQSMSVQPTQHVGSQSIQQNPHQGIPNPRTYGEMAFSTTEVQPVSAYRIAPTSNRLQRNMYGNGYSEFMNYSAIDALPNPGYVSYGPPWAHYLGGSQDRLLGGPLGLPGLRYTAPEGVEHKDYTGVVLG
jgi:hypothetical protein